MLSDLILGSLIPFSIHTIISGRWAFGSLGCTLTGFFFTVANCGSNWALCLVSIERYLAILHPFKHDTYVHYIKYIALILWSFILAHNGVMLHYHDSYIVLDEMYTCGPNMQSYPLYVVILNIFDLLLPDLLIIFTYIQIHNEVKRHNKEIAVNTLRSTSTHGDEIEEQPGSAEWKAALVIIAIVGVFNICWIPLGTGMMVYALNVPLPYGLAASLLWIAITQAGVNPLIYTILNRAYRKEMKRLIRCQLPIQRELSAVSL